MRQVHWASWTVGLAMAFAVSGARPAAADMTSDQAAAILTWPSVIYATDSFGGITVPGATINTILQLSNTSNEPVSAWCFYENANSHGDFSMYMSVLVMPMAIVLVGHLSPQ